MISKYSLKITPSDALWLVINLSTTSSSGDLRVLAGSEHTLTSSETKEDT